MFSGVLEAGQRHAEDLKKIRIDRLRQVRRQEKEIASGHSFWYKETICNRKRAREEILREKMTRDERNFHQNLALQWQQSLVDTGHAHRTAMEQTRNRSMMSSYKRMATARKHLSVVQRGKDALGVVRNMHDASNKTTTNMIDRRLNTIRETGVSDREDARAAAEAKAANIVARSLMAQNTSMASDGTARRSVLQGAVKVQDRGKIQLKKQALVIHHDNRPPFVVGSPGGSENLDSLSIVNEVRLAERDAMKKRFGLVLREMIHRKLSTARASLAKKSFRGAKQDSLESDLALLSSVDNARASKRSSADAAALLTIHGAEGSSLRDFEGEFLTEHFSLSSGQYPDLLADVSAAGDDDVDSIDGPVATRVGTKIEQPRPPAWVIPSGMTKKVQATESQFPIQTHAQTQSQSQSQSRQSAPPSWQNMGIMDTSVLSASTREPETEPGCSQAKGCDGLVIPVTVKGQVNEEELSFEAFFERESEMDELEFEAEGLSEGEGMLAVRAEELRLRGALPVDVDVSEVTIPFHSKVTLADVDDAED